MIAKSNTPPKIMLTNFALSVILVFVLVYTLYHSAAITIPFFIAIFVWYLINATARGLSKMKLGGWSLPSDLSFTFAIFFLIGGLWFGYSIISTQASDVMREVPSYQTKITVLARDFLNKVPEAYRPDADDIMSYLDVGSIIAVFVKNFTGIAGKTLIVLFYTGFLLYEQQFFGRKLQAMAGNKATELKIKKILHNIDTQIQRYIAVKTVISMCTGLSTWLLLTFFSIDFAAFWGMMAFILNFIPYVGSMVSIVLPSLIVFVQLEGDLGQIAVVSGGLAFIQLLWGSIIDPRLTGDHLNLSPIFIIMFLAVWGMIWGVPGMFLSIPILAICVISMSQFRATRPFAILMTKTGHINEG